MMKPSVSVGLITVNEAGKPFQLDPESIRNGYSIQKVLVTGTPTQNRVESHYGSAEIVSDWNSILQDESIDLVLISSGISDHLDIVAETMRSGKPVRIV